MISSIPKQNAIVRTCYCKICVKHEKCANVRNMLVHKMEVSLRESFWSMLIWTLVFLVSLSKSVMSINGLS